ncbi:MAG: hypothetical protein CXT73_05880 [Methanobacteriota archaeon]|nr:MAG: hypothetical protein CXT73_05880 [Euryarchaeota archaeon]
MNAIIDKTTYNIDKVFFGEPIKNTIIENSIFRRIIYTEQHISFNNITLSFNLRNVYIKKYYNKWKCMINDQIFVDYITNFERNILKKLNITNKKSCNAITQQVENGYVKLFSDIANQKSYDTYIIILKVSGVWESVSEYGLTYKVCDTKTIL